MKEENVTNELKKQKLRGGDKSKGRSGNLSSDPKSKIKDIKSMFTAMPAKKKAEVSFELSLSKC